MSDLTTQNPDICSYVLVENPVSFGSHTYNIAPQRLSPFNFAKHSLPLYALTKSIAGLQLGSPWVAIPQSLSSWYCLHNMLWGPWWRAGWNWLKQKLLKDVLPLESFSFWKSGGDQWEIASTPKSSQVLRSGRLNSPIQLALKSDSKSAAFNIESCFERTPLDSLAALSHCVFPGRTIMLSKAEGQRPHWGFLPLPGGGRPTRLGHGIHIHQRYMASGKVHDYFVRVKLHMELRCPLRG